MEFKSIDEILSFAIENEKEAVAFYLSLSKQASKESLSKVFKKYSQEEEKHVKLLSGFADNKEKIESYKFKKVTDLKISDYIVESEYEEGMPMPEILTLAMKKEEKAVMLYTTLKNQTDNEDAKKVFQILVQEEQEHKLALESMYDDFLADQSN